MNHQQWFSANNKTMAFPIFIEVSAALQTWHEVHRMGDQSYLERVSEGADFYSKQEEATPESLEKAKVN